MNEKRHICAQIGDVFSIPLGNGQFAYGQIVTDTIEKYYAIFDYINSISPDIEELVRMRIIFLAMTVDAFIEDGDWPVIGNTRPPPDIDFPEYLIETSVGSCVMNYTGKILRKATFLDMNTLTNRSSFSPKALELAVKVKLGGEGGEWYPAMSKMLYKQSNRVM